ncbi:ABC transporter substrate-binding protein [Actinocorallia longicatena]|uniref:Solute-binding protein family 5 domain-containing protein n=1 Tax=Actinocorallia longicatena TaxID=111803 RepID=A0ABP6QCJ1_9ACTN
MSITPGILRRPRAAAAAFAVAALLASAACGGSSDTPDATGGPTADTLLSTAIQAPPSSFALTQLDGGQGSYVWGSLYDRLLYIDNTGAIKPNAAESFTYSADRKTLTLKLQQGMKFRSGAPVNAAAVKASLDRIRDTPGPNQANEASIASVEAPDESTVVIKLKHPDGSLLVNLAGINGVIGDPATMADPGSATDPMTSGPYELDKARTVPGSAYTLVRRDDYWNVKAYPFKTVRIVVMPDRAAVVNALRSGQLNAASVDPTQVDPLKAQGLQVKPIAASTAGIMFLADRKGTKLKPLGDLKVRQAINQVFDRTKLVQMFLRGSGMATTQVFNPKSQAFDASLDKDYPFDVAAAKKLMAEAGYADGFSVTMPSFVTTKPFEPVVTGALGAIGIKVTWEPVPLQNYSSALSSGKFPMFFAFYGLDHEAVLSTLYFSPGTPTNPFKSADPELTKLLDEANAATDDATAAAAYKKVNQFVVKNAWFAPILDIGTTWVTAKGISYLGDGTSVALDVRTFGNAG